MLPRLKVPVSLSFHGPPGRQVELVGDFPDWKYPVAMTEGQPGSYHCGLELEPGLYRYKFRVDGRLWASDPNARSADSSEPFSNAVLVVEGTLPPVLFAPDRRHVCVVDGRALFHVECSDPSRLPAHAWIRAPHSKELLLAPLEPTASRPGWTLLRGEAKVGTKAAGTPFGIDGCPEQVFDLPASRGALGGAPAWLDGATFYSVFVDRWHRGSSSPPMTGARSRRSPSTATTFYGGDLEGVREGLPYIQKLGVDAIILTPVHPSPTPHRYDPTDLLSVDRELGGRAAMERLVAEAHKRGIKIVADVAVTHVNEAHPAFRDLLLRQERSKYAKWFRVKRFPVVARDTSTFDNYYDRPELPWLDLTGPARRHALKAVEHLVRLGVDGLRLDAMNDAPADFWEELRARARAINPELALLGEIISDTPHRFAEERGVDCATDFSHRDAMIAFFARGSVDAATFWDWTRTDSLRRGPFPSSFHLLFLDNHDTARFLSLAVLYDRLRLALAYLLLRPEPVSLTWGTESGLTGSDPSGLLDDAWPERLPMPALDAAPTRTVEILSTLCRLRRTFRGVPLKLVRAEGRLLVVERKGKAGVLTAWLNAGESQVYPEVSGALALAVNDSGQGPLAPCSARLFVSKK